MMALVRTWRNREQRYRLVGKRCRQCHNLIFPSEGECPRCSDQARSQIAQSLGSTADWTPIVFEAPASMREHLYVNRGA